MEKYYLNYLKNTTNDELVEKYITFLKAELDWHFYATGEDLESKYHRENKVSLDRRLKELWKLVIALFVPVSTCQGKQVLSFFHFPTKLKDISIYSSIVQPVGSSNIVGNFKTYKDVRFVEKVIRTYDFNKIISDDVINALNQQLMNLEDLYFHKMDFRALFLYTDQYFFAKQHIDIFRKKGLPSFIFTHGLPGVYSKDVDNSSDYLLVWGEKMKQNYIDAGFSPNKIIPIGNFRYKTIPQINHDIKSNLDDVLVISSSSVTWHQNTWGEPSSNDRSLIFLFLLQVENALKKNGVKHARLRPHPAVNKQWLDRFIDKDFYTIDYDTLANSLHKSTLVIGQTSSVVIEALMNGVNFIAFEPIDERGYTVRNAPAVPPFDGNDPYLCLAKNQEELELMIKDNCISDVRLVQEYIQPFNPKIIESLVS